MRVLRFAFAGACAGLVAGYGYSLMGGGFVVGDPAALRMGVAGLAGGAVGGLVIGLLLRTLKT